MGGCGTICRWEVNYDQLTLLNHHCCLCGLLCSVPMSWPGPGRRNTPECERLRSWLSAQDAHGSGLPPAEDPMRLSEHLASHAGQLAAAHSPLVWIESGDVSATRAAVHLAQISQATVHVAESPGAHSVAMVTGTSGTFGTSLAEVWQHADVLVHLGYQHLREMPLLAPRFLTAGGVGQPPTGRRHVFIDDDPAAAFQCAGVESLDASSSGPLLLKWPRSQWLEHFTRLLLAIRGNVVPDHLSADSQDVEDAEAMQLAELLAGSRYAVFIWAEDALADEADRLLVERLLEVAAKLTEVTRCSLLPLGADPGRTTSKETLLWLTNYSTTARFVDGHWRKPHLGENVSLDDWQREHDWILAVRTLPSDRPLPDLNFNLMIDAACNFPLHAARPTDSRAAPDVIAAAAVGLDCAGHVTRVDHAFGAYLNALKDSPGRYPTAAQVMAALADGYRATGGRGC